MMSELVRSLLSHWTLYLLLPHVQVDAGICFGYLFVLYQGLVCPLDESNEEGGQ